MKDLWQRVRQFFEWLSSKPKIGGLEITNSGVNYVHFDGALTTFSLRFPPGTIREGKVEDPAKLLEIFQEFYRTVDAEKRGRPIHVVVVLPAASVYTQSFEIPNVGMEKLAESANLNLQMISPMPKENAYASFQVLRENPDRYELLGAFAERILVDQYKDLLTRAGFSPVAFEFPGLSLARLFQSVGGTQAHASLLFHVSSDGLNLLTVRSGGLYFNYFRSWQSIQGEAREISRQRFEEVVVQEVQKVINFSLGHFKEAPEHLILIAPGLEHDLKLFLESQFHIPIVPLEVPGWSVTPQWFVGLGAAFRGAMERGEDRDISLMAETPTELFFAEQLFDFIRLWRLVIAGVLGVLLIFFGGAAYFLAGQAKDTKAQFEQLRGRDDEKELRMLEAKVEEFNRLVRAVGNIRAAALPWSSFFEHLSSLASKGQVKMDHIEVIGANETVSLTARAPSYDSVIAFKNILAGDPGFAEVNFPVSQTSTLEDGSVSFVLTFRARFTP